jgi:hypothetical protein
MLPPTLAATISPKIVTGVSLFGFGVLDRKFNRIAKCGTANGSASADLFVSPKTKSRPGYTRAAKKSLKRTFCT